MTQQTEKICFRYDGSEEAKKCIEWINQRFHKGKLIEFEGMTDRVYDNNGFSWEVSNPHTPMRLVTPAEFLRLVSKPEPKWKVGDECEFIDCGSHTGVIIAIKDNWIWVLGKDHSLPRTVGVDDLRPIRKSLREELKVLLHELTNEYGKEYAKHYNKQLKTAYGGQVNVGDYADRIIQLLKERGVEG